MSCTECMGYRIAFLILSADLTPKKVQQDENELAYCYDCKKIVEVKMKLQRMN